MLEQRELLCVFDADPCKALDLLSKKQYAPNAEMRFMIKLLTDL